MTLSETRKNFIKEFYNKCNSICPSYGLVAITAIVAQACNESRYGESELSSKYHNYWGMKCGSSYKGKSVNMTTKEEYTAGTTTTIKDNFRAYDSMDDGIKGYCEFITGMSRYKNLIGITDDTKYIETIKADGWATDSKYITTVSNIVPTVKEVIGDTTTVETAPAQTPSKDSNVERAQKAINLCLGLGLAVDGIRGSKTNKGLVKMLQYGLNRDYDAKLDTDGVVGSKTMGAYEGKVVKKGSRGYLVSWLETVLVMMGYYNGSIEFAGIFGSGMDGAVREYQGHAGLTVDGKAGKDTINAILSELGLK